MSDFCFDLMPSPDGLGKAKNNFQKVWATYVKTLEPATNATEPALSAMARPVAQVQSFDLFGFWFACHLVDWVSPISFKWNARLEALLCIDRARTWNEHQGGCGISRAFGSRFYFT